MQARKPTIPVIAWQTSRRRKLAAGLAAIALLASEAAYAQSQDARLEDLIPDEAVANPDAWAAEGVTPEAQAAELAGPELEADSPLAELPELSVPWPDDTPLPELVELTPEDDIEFAELDPQVAPPAPELEVRQLGPSLAIAYPTTAEDFPPRDDFLARFEALSSIEEYDNADTNVAQLAARARQDEELLNTLLRIYGYYDAQVTRTIGELHPGEDKPEPRGVRFDIIPGPRYAFGQIDLGALDTAPDAAALRRAFEVTTGQDMSSDLVIEEQADLDRMLGETGYAFASIEPPEFLVDHARREGDLTMRVDPKGKYTFGEVTSSDAAFLPSWHLARIARFEPGEIYQRSLSLDLRRAITATGLVSGVTIAEREVTPPSGDQPGVVAMDVNFTRAPVRTVAGAIGYGSEEGFRLAASWEHRNLFPPEGALRLRGVLGTREQLAGITFRKNNFRGRDRVLTLDAYASTLGTGAYEARTASLVGTYEHLSNLLYQKPFGWSVGLEVLATSERPRPVVPEGVDPDTLPLRPRETFFIAALPLYALIDTSDDLLNPTKGFRLGARLSPEASRTNSANSFYLRSQVDATYYRQINDRIVIAGRGAVAAIPGAELFDIAPSRRLYAGGGTSVRGYGFQRISPVNALGERTGGRSLVEGSIEARVNTPWFGGALQVVPFVDAASVSTDVVPDFSDIRIGAGVGVRYLTGFGPIRVDVGVPLNKRADDNWVAVYVSLGQAF